jgi:scyllo-inositol 2-dehydrogenase (NADP+)
MIRAAIVGLGKMGLSHLAILRAHPEIQLVAACDGLGYLTSALERYSGIKCYTDFDEMLRNERLEALLIATPSKSHAALVKKALDKQIHVFCEKPFVLEHSDGLQLVEQADKAQLVTQVGYHYRFVATFGEAARIVRSGVLGRVHHVRAEAHGPVVLRPKGSTWRSNRQDGGGVVYDYACHAIDLVHFVVGDITSVSGVVRSSVFSRDVDDEVYCSFQVGDSVSGQLSVNWSDESCRKMTTRVSVWGENGLLKVDRQECQIYLREPVPGFPRLKKGWTTLNITELLPPEWFYLRGEEYSRQIDQFARRINAMEVRGENDFRSALATDRVVAMIHGTLTGVDSGTNRSAARSGIFGRLKQRIFGSF